MSEILKFKYASIDYNVDWWHSELLKNHFICSGFPTQSIYQIVKDNYSLVVLINDTSLCILVKVLDLVIFSFNRIPLENPDLFALCFKQAQTFMNERETLSEQIFITFS